jgi:hypothetical protein
MDVVGPRDFILEKPRFGAFHGTDLEQTLRGRGIETLTISGSSSTPRPAARAGRARIGRRVLGADSLLA